jgi:hypothetical protein
MKGVAARLVRRASPLAVSALTHPCTRDARRRLLAGEPHRVRYFHQVDDPHGQLAAQVLPRLLERYDVEEEIRRRAKLGRAG